ncbi:uncharacterized protein I303_107645 [Kwoniella dejecticola CBS 10117]|uniref:DUF4604 domain-containing protein n=1 Tax=Kwoniella dejecticola CBS 10117 TaxID=1296121 RepID=A0A1A5ZVB2_9TREE|nr:uncharacterized protein I303_07656 [Kwoniella dejecticola CBS 10117]OBR81746.1 hypothetical protein I303_07656 [Kwoniella dejecticola CBS 10117]
MSRKGGQGQGPTRQQYSSGLSYVANTPKFLQNFGQPSPSPSLDSTSASGPSRGGRRSERDIQGQSGREALPSRPKEGKWANGSDDEDAPNNRANRKANDEDGDEDDEDEDEDEDEWGETFGGGADGDGPQIVVLKEGRHLDEDEVKRIRRRAKGERSPSPPASNTPNDLKKQEEKEKKTSAIIPKSNTNKRKLVGNDRDQIEAEEEDKGSKKDGEEKKKKKAKKGMLSFNEAEGED